MRVEIAHLSWNISDPTQPAILDDGRAEPNRAHSAFLDYLHLGPGRTLPALLQQYQGLAAAPTHSHGTLRNWSQKFEWTPRSARYDTADERRANAEYRARRAAIMQRGLTRDHERVENLTTLYEKLAALSRDEDALWLKDFKILRLPDGTFERVEIRRFNGDLIRQMRGLLDDIASETGGRLLRTEPQPSEAGESDPFGKISFEVLTPDERKEFYRLYDKIESHQIESSPLD